MVVYLRTILRIGLLALLEVVELLEMSMLNFKPLVRGLQMAWDLGYRDTMCELHSQTALSLIEDSFINTSL
jgi:hypothetical protein